MPKSLRALIAEQRQLVNEYEEPPEEYRGYEIRVHPTRDAVFRWVGCAYPVQVTSERPRAEHAEGQTPEEAFEKTKAKVDRQLSLGS